MKSASTHTPAGASRAARYAALVQKLESSCVTCSTAHDMRAVSPAAHTRNGVAQTPCQPHNSHDNDGRCGSRRYLQKPSRSPSHDLLCGWSRVAQSSWSASSESWSTCASQRWGEECTQPDESPPVASLNIVLDVSAASPPPLFEVRCRKKKHARVIRSNRQARSPSGREDGACAPPRCDDESNGFPMSQLPTTHDPSPLPRRCRHCTGVMRLTRTAATADDYLRLYLSQYRRPSSYPLSAQTGRDTGCLECARAGTRHADTADVCARSPTGAEQAGRSSLPDREWECSPCVPTPACSPIVAERGAAGSQRDGRGCDSPDIVCRLFTSVSTESAEVR